jgi:hypothetical protein
MIKSLKDFLYRKKKIQVELPVKVSEEDFDNFIYNWNVDNSIDRWYRQKYGIKFNSPEHRVLSFIDMAFEWREDKIYEKALKEEMNKYTRGDYLKKQEFKNEDLPSDEDLMNLDFSKFDD